MLKIVLTSFVILGLASTAALAACPPLLPDNLPEAVAENGRRLVCLQNELAEAARQRSYDFQLKSLERSINTLELDRKLQTIQPPPPPVIIPVYPKL